MSEQTPDIVPAQGGHDFAHGQAGVRIVALHGPGNRGRFRLLVNGGEHLVKPRPALGGNGYHGRAQKFGQRRAIHAAAIFKISSRIFLIPYSR